MPEVGTLDELKNYMMTVIAEIGDNFRDPDDDWMMVGAFEDLNGQMHLGQLPNEAFVNGATKDALAVMLRDYIAKNNIVNYAILFNVHGKASASKEEFNKLLQRTEQGDRIQHMEGAFELLMLVVGNKGAEKVYRAEITRDGVNPPKLGEWELLDRAEHGGRFVGFNEAIKPMEI